MIIINKNSSNIAHFDDLFSTGAQVTSILEIHLGFSPLIASGEHGSPVLGHR